MTPACLCTWLLDCSLLLNHMHSCKCQAAITACCRGEGSVVWFAELNLIFSYKDGSGARREAAFVRWYVQSTRPARANQLRLTCLRHEKERVPGLGRKPHKHPRTNVISVHEIIGPCCIQPDPVDPDIFWYNHWVGSTPCEEDEPVDTPMNHA